MKYDGNFIKMTLINKNRIEIGKIKEKRKRKERNGKRKHR